jgi:Domain of unknown function (DUF4276)
VVTVRVFVEGGGDTVDQRAQLRRSLGQWIERALPGARGRLTVHPCGSRAEAFEKFSRAVGAGPCLLLVDSEEAIVPGPRWSHVHTRTDDGWARPDGASEEHLHFMAQTMETWLCADGPGLATYYRSGFDITKLPARPNLEEESKQDVYSKLQAATRRSQRGSYHKGRHVEVLRSVSPDLVMARCPHARLFIDTVRAMTNA